MKTATPESRRPAVDVTPDPAPPRPAEAVPPVPAGGGRTPWWVWVLVTVALAAAVLGVVHRVRTTRAATAAEAGGRKGGNRDLPVVVATARRGDLPIYLYGLGTVTPLKTVSLRTRVDGAITKINYVEGQHVKVGDFLLQIDPRPYQAALDQAKGQLVKDQATLASANWNVTQDQQALQTKAIAEQQLHTDTATRDSTQGSIDVDRANIEAAQVNVDYCHVTSPIDGVVGLRQVDAGNIVHAADTAALVVIAQEQPITVVFTLAEDDLEQLRQRMNTGRPVPVDAYDRTLTHRLGRGTLLATDSEIDPTTGTIKIKAQFDNADHGLFPDQFVNARLLVDTVTGAVLVPSAAVQHDAAGATFVYVVRAEGDAHAVKVRPVAVGQDLTAVGPDEANTTAVKTGLEPGEVVVTDGVDKLTDGSKVTPRQGEGRRGATRPTTGAAGPVDETGVSGPAMDRPDAGGRPGARGDATTRPFTGGEHRHRRAAD